MKSHPSNHEATLAVSVTPMLLWCSGTSRDNTVYLGPPLTCKVSVGPQKVTCIVYLKAKAQDKIEWRNWKGKELEDTQNNLWHPVWFEPVTTQFRSFRSFFQTTRMTDLRILNKSPCVFQSLCIKRKLFNTKCNMNIVGGLAVWRHHNKKKKNMKGVDSPSPLQSSAGV